jgi:peptide/nickel transport system permease protein
MGIYIVRRLGLLVVLVFFMLVAMFLLQNVIPADPARAMLGPQASQAAVDAMTRKMGLNDPLYVQFGRYVWNILHLNLGTSNYDGQPVRDSIAKYAPASIELAIVATILSVVIGFALGVFSAVNRGSAADGVLRLGAISGRAIPSFWLALLLQIVFYGRLGWFPDGARLNLLGSAAPTHITGMYLLDSVVTLNPAAFRDAAYHLTLPALALAIGGIAEVQRLTAAQILTEMRQDYTRTAHAKGLPSRVVLFRHVIRNAINPVVTVIGIRFGYLLAGTVLIETIFRWPGIGRYALLSIQNLDFPAIMGVTLFVAVIFAVVNLGVDIVYGYLDPRIRYS